MPPKTSITGSKKSITGSKKSIGGSKKSIAGSKKSITGKKKSMSGSRKSMKRKSMKRKSSAGRRRSSAGSKGRRSSKGRKSIQDALSELPEYNAENVRDAMHEMGSAESPINLSMNILKKIRLPPITWYNYDVKAHAMKLSNTAYSVVLTGLWGEHSKPYINGGPFLDDYEFSQIHFHWGQNNNEGSEHTVDGVAHPFELHAVFFKKSYGTHERAKAEEDGIAVLVYLFKIAQTTNPKLQPITDSLSSVVNAYSDASIDPVPLMSLIKNFTDDYILYLGIMKYKCAHGVLWLICRDTCGITEAQLEPFRSLLDKFGNQMPKTFRDPQDLQNRTVFLIAPKLIDGQNVMHAYTEPVVKKPKKDKKKKKKSRKSKKSKKKKKKKKKKSRKSKKKKNKKRKKGSKKSSKRKKGKKKKVIVKKRTVTTKKKRKGKR